MRGFRPALAVLLLCFCTGYAEDAGDDVEFLIGLYTNVRRYNSSEFNSYEYILNTEDIVSHVDYHLGKNLVFIGTKYNVYRGQLKPADNSTVKSILSYNDTWATLAVDWVHDKIYYMQKVQDNSCSLNVMNLDGSNVKHLLNIRDRRNIHIRRILVDPYQGKLFWTRFYNREEGILESSDTTGANHQKIGNMINVGREIFVDVAAKRIFFTLFNEASHEVGLDEYYSLHSMDYNGGEKQDHFHSQQMHALFGLYYHNGYVYWVDDHNGGKIYKAPLNQSSSAKFSSKMLPVRFEDYNIMHMNVVHPDFQKQS